MKITMYETKEGTPNLGINPEYLTWRRETDASDEEVFDPAMNMSVQNSCGVNVYPEVEYQRIFGFGGAMTQASALNLLRMPEEKRREIYRTYFGKEGIRYNYCRIHIGSSDFCESPYDYVEEGDAALDTFSLKQEEETVFRVIKEIEADTGCKLEIIATPWSPPAWMKTNQNRCNGGKLKKEYNQVWADYYVKYILLARQKGIHVSILSIQNEPNANVSWDSCIYTAQEERDFLKKYLGPTLEKNGLGDVKILIWDHNKDLILPRVSCIMEDPEAARYVWGAAFHWYAGDHFSALDIVHQRYPQLHLFYTEGCHGGVSRKTGKWCAGETFAHEMFGDLNHWTEACIDWNLVLNRQGGPSYAGNYCDAPILCGDGYQDYQMESTFYYIGHFSKFVKPGAVRIGCSRFAQSVEACAFKNPDGQLVLVVMNRNGEKQDLCIRCKDQIAFAKMSGHSIATFLF